MASLQDQLLKAGIVDAKKAKKLVKEKRKETKSQPKGHARVGQPAGSAPAGSDSALGQVIR